MINDPLARRRRGDDAIREWIVRHEGRQLSGPQIRFRETVIGLPENRVARWLERRSCGPARRSPLIGKKQAEGEQAVSPAPPR
jgi:hypothetical protein